MDRCGRPVSRGHANARRWPQRAGIRPCQLAGRATLPGDESARILAKVHGMVLAAEKRMFNGWQALASYTYSKVTGRQASSGTTPGGAQLSTIALNSNTFGRDP